MDMFIKIQHLHLLYCSITKLVFTRFTPHLLLLSTLDSFQSILMAKMIDCSFRS